MVCQPLESLSCGTPIIVNMTGGLQEQVTDGENWFGVGIRSRHQKLLSVHKIYLIFMKTELTKKILLMRFIKNV